MEEFPSEQVSSLPADIEKVGDFLYHEGPLISLYRDKNNWERYYFFKWTDCDEHFNRWFVFSFSTQDLKAFLFQEVSLLQLIKKNKFVYFIDIDNDIEHRKYWKAEPSQLPKDYLPLEDSFYEEGTFTELAFALKNDFQQKASSQLTSRRIKKQDLVEKIAEMEIWFDMSNLMHAKNTNEIHHAVSA